MTATFETVRDIGWEYYEQLAKQNIMQVQSATDPPKKLALGERSVMADGTEYNVFLLKESGQPVEVVYPTEGTPFSTGPNGIFKAAPNPNAAKLFQNYCFTPEAQALVIEVGGLRSLHPQVKEKPGRKPLAEIKLMKEDAEGVQKQSEEIKARYQKIFTSDATTGLKEIDDAKVPDPAHIIKGSTALGLTVFASPLKAAAPEPVAITPALIDAANKEGKVILYSSMDLPVGEKLGKAFEAKYPGIAVQIERSGSERLFQRVAQEFGIQHPRRRRDQQLGRLAFHQLEEKRLDGAVRQRRHRPAFSAAVSRSRRHVRDLAHLSVVDRLQHQSGEARGCAQKLCGFARPEMGRQNGQGPSRL